MVQKWYYVKYRFDHHFHHRNEEAPPLQPMWEEGILHFHTLAAQEWMPRKELQDMYAEMSSDDSQNCHPLLCTACGPHTGGDLLESTVPGFFERCIHISMWTHTHTHTHTHRILCACMM